MNGSEKRERGVGIKGKQNLFYKFSTFIESESEQIVLEFVHFSLSSPLHLWLALLLLQMLAEAKTGG